MTRRLYHLDAYQRSFEGVVTAVRGPGDGGPGDGGPAVALTETAFYPASGGQPCDRGTLADRVVTEVLEDGGEIWHRLEGTGAPPPGARVAGVIDWTRRFDHMQQHTGQHILSQAFLQVVGAPTISVHMGTECTLDLREPSLEPSAAAGVERLANQIVLEDRPVTTREVEGDDVERLGLRRPARHHGRLRVVEVEGFDRSACGGTHVRATGEVGPIAIRGWERYKGGVRVTFLCGWRVLDDYRRGRGLLRALARDLTTGEDDLPAAIARLAARARDLERALADARGRLLDGEAERLLAGASPDPADPAGPRIVTAAFADRAPADLRALGWAVVARAPCVAILASESDRRLVVVRSAALPVDAATALREALAPFGGRGGGTPEAAEGTAPQAPSAAALVDAARSAALRRGGVR